MANYGFNLVDKISPWIAGDFCYARAWFDLTNGNSGGGLSLNDTVTATNIIPGNGVEILEILISSNELDTNATPTFAYSVGDSNNAARFILTALGSVNGITSTNYQVRNGINIASTTTSGVITSGAGYVYTGETPSSLILKVTTGAATKVTAGVIHMLVLYRCVGNS